MKIKIVLFLLLFFTKAIYSQVGYSYLHPYPQCPTPYADWYDSTTSQPSICAQLLKDFIPTPADRDLVVNLNFWVFNKTNGTGRWSAATEGQADSLILQLNSLYGNIDSAYLLTSPPAPYVSDTKIRFRKKSYNSFNVDLAYDSIGHVTNPYFIHDCNAINIIFAKYDAHGEAGGYTYENPGKYVFMPADTDLDSDNQMRKINNYQIVSGISHELGHALGLDEAWIIASFSCTKPEMGLNSCCDLMIAKDYIRQTTTDWNSKGNCATPVPHGPFSNNFMSYNGGCRHYFSPLQMALMHYHLRTDMKDVLYDMSSLRVNHAFDYQLAANETWAADRYMKGDVIIPSGKMLTISHALGMTQSARIIVQTGGQLVLNGGVSNISGQLWSGIQVAGTSTLDQSFNLNGFASHQGVFRAESSSASYISNAENGIKNYSTDTLGNVDFNSTGGIIIANNVNFLNNTRDVEFLTYNSHPSVSIFNKCLFKTTSLLNNATSGLPAAPLTHVSLWDIDGVLFRGCAFQYTAGSAYNDPGEGITSLDANYIVNKYGTTASSFKNLRQGICALNSNPLRVPVITNTSFVDNIDDAAYFQNANSLVFNKNFVQALGPAFSNGVYLNSCQQYNIKNNTFFETTGITSSSYGITTYNSMAGSHQVYKNTFNNLYVGIAAVGNNSGASNLTNGLKMTCNDFSAVSNLYDIALMPPYGGALPTVMTSQGPPLGPFTALQPVRNIYGASSNCSTCENKWYIEGTSAKPYNHPVNTQAVTQPTPQPDYSDVAVNVIQTGVSLDYTAHCTSGQNSTGDPTGNPSAITRLQNINSYLSGLKASTPPKSDPYHFEIEASLSAKLYLFLTDSLLTNKDSVVSLFASNVGRIEDADILKVYALINKGDLTAAQTAANALPLARHDWKDILTKQIYYRSHPDQLYHLSHDDISFWEDRADDEAGSGFGAAQAILKRFADEDFDDPRPEPTGGLGARHIKPMGATEVGALDITIYPNPAHEQVTLAYNNSTGHVLEFDLTDAIGHRVSHGTVKPGEKFNISLIGLTNGIYLLNLYDAKVPVYHKKVICIK